MVSNFDPVPDEIREIIQQAKASPRKAASRDEVLAIIAATRAFERQFGHDRFYARWAAKRRRAALRVLLERWGSQ